MCLVLAGGHALVDGVAVRCDVSIADGAVIGVGRACEGGERCDASGLVIVPGLHNGHMHAATSLLQGMPRTGTLDSWVSSLWRFECGITPKEAYWGSLYAACRMLLSGITSFEDLHFFQGEVAKACTEAGIRATLSEALMDRQPWRAPSSVSSSLALGRAVRNEPLLTAKMGIVSVRMASEALIDEAVEAYASHEGLFSGYHLHMDEVPADRVHSMDAYGCSPTDFFFNKGVLAPGTTVAHCVHPSPHDISVLASSGARIAHCPGSNLGLRSGTAPVGAFLAAEATLCLGIDSPSICDGYDLWRDYRLVSLLHGVAPRSVLPLMAGTAGVHPGMPADLVFLDRRAFFPHRDAAGSLVLAASPADVRHVMVGGRFVVRDRSVCTLDADRGQERALEAADEVWSRLEASE